MKYLMSLVINVKPNEDGSYPKVISDCNNKEISAGIFIIGDIIYYDKGYFPGTSGGWRALANVYR